MRVLLFGPPGVGKGTQADLLTNKYRFTKFSMGDILREEIKLNSSLGGKIGNYVDQGNLVPDEIVFELVDDFLRENRNAHILFDGFPRNVNQALSLERSLAQLDLSLDIALDMHISEDEIINRLTNRRYCPNCGRIYNYVTDPPKVSDICDACGNKLVKRVDDDETIVRRRLAVYEEQTKLLSEHYKSLSVYRVVDAGRSQREVFENISEIIDEYLNKR